jgi:hypothetical protein
MIIKTLNDTLQKKCLIGLTYFDVNGVQLKQTLLAGTVTSVDEEMGIKLNLLTVGSASNINNKSTKNNSAKKKSSKGKEAEFILPSNTSCWFTAPKGDFHTSVENVKITDPDYLITWDIYQTKAQKTEDGITDNIKDGEQQWWQWRPRTQKPQVG